MDPMRGRSQVGTARVGMIFSPRYRAKLANLGCDGNNMYSGTQLNIVNSCVRELCDFNSCPRLVQYGNNV